MPSSYDKTYGQHIPSDGCKARQPDVHFQNNGPIRFLHMQPPGSPPLYVYRKQKPSWAYPGISRQQSAHSAAGSTEGAGTKLAVLWSVPMNTINIG